MKTIDRRRFLTIASAAGAAAAVPGGFALAGTGKTRAESNPYALRSGPLKAPYVPRRAYAEGPYGQVHFRDTGEGIPLVLCHQAPQTSKQFTNVYEPLHRRGLRAIGVDTPGFGESDPTPFVPTVEDWAAAVPAVLDHLGIEKAHVLGHHTGGMVATEVALQFPGRVRKLIINGPLPMSEERRLKFLEGNEEREINFVYADDGSHLQQSFMGRHNMYGAGADPRTITRYTVEKFQGYAPFWTGHHAAFIYDHGAALKKIKQATLILTNTGDQIYENAQLARELRPDFAYKELAGGGIDIVDQMPEEWADAVAAFLKD
jgi:pimeloyl-ACP methyl ester carboxylesterase